MVFMQRERFGERDKRDRDKDDKKKKRRSRGMSKRRKVCRLFKDKETRDRFRQGKRLVVNYKDLDVLSQFLSERGKIIPRRITGTTKEEQEAVTLAIKRARIMALIPFTATQSATK